MQNLSVRTFALLGAMFYCMNLFSQKWNLVWREDFGVAEDTVIKDFPDPSMSVPRHYFAVYQSKEHRNNGILDYHEKGDSIGECGCIDDALYGIANNTRWAYQRFKHCGINDGGHFVAGKDHTGNKNGAMLIVNSEVGTGLPIYQQDIKFDLCDSREYKFVIYASSVTTYNEDGGNANLELKVVNVQTGDIVKSIKTGDIPFWQFNGWGEENGGRGDVTAQREWTEYATEPFTVNNGDKLQLQVTNWGSGHNDFAIDDISLYRNDDVEIIDPTISSNTFSSASTVSAGNCVFSASFEVPVSVLTNWKKVYDNVYFLWQSSKDDGLTWENRMEVSGIDQISATMDVSSEETEVYRVIITGSASESEAKEQALYIAQTGGPKDGCSYYSISNTLAGVSPTPDCSYNENLRTLWHDDFGVLGEESRGSSSDMKLRFYSGNTDAIAMGEYAIVSNPESALKNSSWDQEEELSDASGLANGGMIYTKLDKSSGDDEKDLIYEKVIPGKLCPCKSMCFSFFAFDRWEWAGETLLGRVMTDNDEIIGETTLELTNSNSKKWVQCSVPFTLPQSYTGSLHLQILNKTKQNTNVKIAFDNFSVYICGETAPQGTIQIDQHPTLAYLGGDDCSEATNTLSISDDAQWKKAYPNYGVAWQKSTDHGITWSFAGSEKKIPHQNSKGGLTEYRAVFAETQEAAEQAAKNGLPNDVCLVFGFSNRLGIECQTEPCKAPQFESKGEETLTICSDRTEPVVFEVTQKDEVNVDKMQWFSKSYDQKEWEIMENENETTLNINQFDIDSTDYLFIAHNDTCHSDSILFRLNIHQQIELIPIDTTICEGSDITLKAQVKEGSSIPTEYVWSKTAKSTRDEIVRSDVRREETITLSANNGVCFAPDVTNTIRIEKKYNPQIVWNDIKEVPGCKDSTEIFILIGSENWDPTFFDTHTSEWREDDATISKEFTLPYTFKKDATLTHIVTGQKCKPVHYDFNITVLPTPTLNLTVSHTTLCENETLSMKASVENATKYNWHFLNADKSEDKIIEEASSLTEKKIQVSESGFYYISTTEEEGCGPIYSDTLFVEVKKALVYEIEPLPAIICEGSLLKGIATPKTGEATSTQWIKNGKKISDGLTFEEQPTEASNQYEFVAKREGCPDFTAPFTVNVTQPSPIGLSVSKENVCDIDPILLNAEKEDSKIVEWQISTDGESFTTFAEGSTLSQPFQPTDASLYYFRLAANNGECGIDYSDTVTVHVFKQLAYDFSEVDPTICAGTILNFSATPTGGEASSVQWEREMEGNLQIFSGELSISDQPSNNCTYTFKAQSEACPPFTTPFSIEVENPSTLTLGVSKENICEGDAVTLSTQIGETPKVKWQYSVDGGEFQSFSEALNNEESYSISTGDVVSFRIETTSEGKCPIGYSNTVSVSVEHKATLTAEKTEIGICEGNSAELSFEATLGTHNTIQWSDERNTLPNQTKKSLTVTPTETTIYKATILGEACPPVPQTFTVEVEKEPSLHLLISNEESCEGNMVTLSLEVQNASLFEWQVKEIGQTDFSTMETSAATTQKIEAKNSTSYLVKAASAKYCANNSSNEVSLLVEHPITIQLAEKKAICEGDEITIEAEISGTPSKITWSRQSEEESEEIFLEDVKSFTDQPSSATTYTIKASSRNCHPNPEASIKVDVEKRISLNMVSDVDSICEGSSIKLNTDYQGTGTITWESKTTDQEFSIIREGDTEIEEAPSQTTEYKVSAISETGCPATPAFATVTVSQPSDLKLEDMSICLGDSAQLKVKGALPEAKLSWFSSEDEFNQPFETESNVTVTPQASTNYKVIAINGKCENEASAQVEVVPAPTILSCEEVGIGAYEVNAESTVQPLYFDFGQGPTLSNRLENIIYGQKYTVKVSTSLGCATTYVLETPTYELEIPEYFVPSNGNWEIKNIERFPNTTVKIYDRFGKVIQILESDDDGWDGTYNGRPLPSTDYWYIINVPEIRRIFRGHFTLIRTQ